MRRHPSLPRAQPPSHSYAADRKRFLQAVRPLNSRLKLALTSHRPGDYLRAEDDEIEGFKARLNERLAPVGTQFTGEGVNDEWQVGDTLAQWWRPNFETFMYPFIPAHVTRPKECKKLYFIQLPRSSTLITPYTSAAC
jgi:hypothetical protein